MRDGAYSDAAETSTVGKMVCVIHMKLSSTISGSEDLDNIIDDDTDNDGILLTEADIPSAKSSRDKALGKTICVIHMKLSSTISGSDYLDKITDDDPDDGILLTEADIPRVKSSGDKALGKMIFVIHMKLSITMSGSEDLDDDPDDDAILLTEADIPGASLNGKHPSELNVTELKRWLNCRGAPVSGRKPELIDR